MIPRETGFEDKDRRQGQLPTRDEKHMKGNRRREQGTQNEDREQRKRQKTGER